MSVETIVPESNGKYGPKVDGVFYSFSKFFKGNKELALGQPVQVDIFVSDSGKKYINAVIGEVKAPPLVAPVFKDTPTAKPLPTTDWAAKDRSQLVGGRSHDAVSLVNTALITGEKLEKVMEMYKEALQGVLKLAEEVK